MAEDDAPKKAAPKPQRQPLRQLSAREEPHLDCSAPAITSFRPSSIGELVQERDWIYPVPADKPDFGPVLDEHGSLEDIPDRRKHQISDLSFAVNVTAADSTFDSSFYKEDEIDTQNILKDLDL